MLILISAQNPTRFPIYEFYTIDLTPTEIVSIKLFLFIMVTVFNKVEGRL